MSNVTCVSFLISCENDRVPIKQRIEWFQPLLDTGVYFILFVDAIYAEWLGVLPNVKIIILELEDLDTIRTIRAAGNLELPPQRSIEKDTLNFLSFMNCKPELLVIAAPYVTTPYIAYIDAGISKVFKDPNTLMQLKTLNIHDVPLILLPGCNAICELETYPYLWRGINWMFSGGFFIVPKASVDEWYTLHMTALKKFLSMGAITWEVNVWASFAHSVKDRIVWYSGPHNDTMITGIPTSVQTTSGDSSTPLDTNASLDQPISP